MERIKVLHIAGTGRNGSTLLGSILGQCDGFTNVGELIDIGLNLAPKRPPCGCGTQLSGCHRWKAVVNELFQSVDQTFIPRMHRLRGVETMRRNLPYLITSAGLRKLDRRFAKARTDLETLFRAIQKEFKSTVIVDSSKQPMYLHLLSSIEAIDLYVVHLIRDPRALALAYERRVEREGYVLHMSPFRTSVQWLRRNSAIEFLTRNSRRKPLRIRYKDLAARPYDIASTIVKFAGENCAKLPFEDEHIVNLRALHTVAGNPNRFITGRVEIRNDEKWPSELGTGSKLLVTAMTWPFLLRYGYRISPGAAQISHVMSKESMRAA